MTGPVARDMSRIMEPLFLIIGCLIVGYPDEAMSVIGAYLWFCIARYILRSSW